MALSERDVCTKFITPALERAGWDVQTQIREEVTLTAGKVLVRGKLVARGKSKRAPGFEKIPIDTRMSPNFDVVGTFLHFPSAHRR